MTAEFETVLAQVAQDVFASMAFIMPLDGEPSAADEHASPVLAQVSFAGPCDGKLTLSVSANMMPTLATNMLGLEEGSCASVEQHQDALKELLNVVCGNLLPLITSPRDVFDVHEPRIVNSSEEAADLGSSDPEAEVKLWLDCGQADLALFLNNPSPVSVA